MNAMITKGYQDVPMTRRRAQLLAEYADKLAEMLENAPDDQDLAEWIQSKIDRAAGAIQSAYHYLDQEDDEELEKAVGHKYTHRKRVGTDKRGRARYRYYYAEHQGGGITRASFEAGSAFKLTWKGRRGHFHIDRVEGDQVFITHDSRPDMEPVAISKSELRALLKRQHTKAEQAHVEKRRKEVEKIKSRNVKRGLGLALHRLRQAATQAGVELDERYQRKPKKKKRPAQVTDTPREDRFDTMPEVEAPEKGEPVQDERFEYGLELEALAKRAGLKYSEQGVTHSVDARLVRDNEPRVMISAPQLQKVYPKLTQEQVNDFKARAIAYLKEFTGDDLTEDIQHTAQSNQTRSRMIYKELDAAISHIINEVGRGGREERRATLQAVKMLAEWREATQPTPRNELTETAQQIIEEANQEHEERHDEHQEITKFELGEHTHTRTGQKLYTAQQTERVDRDEYFRRVEIAKKYRGRYERRYVKGFVFKNAEDARAFALEVEGAAQTPESAPDPDVREQAKSTFHRLSGLVHNLKSWTVMKTQTDHAVYHSASSAVTILKRGGKYFVEVGPVDDRLRLTMGTIAHFLRTPDGKRGFDTARQAAKAAISFMRENDAETVTPHEDHPSADNFETMPEVETPKSSAREQELFSIVYDKTLDRKQAVKKRHRQAYLDLIEKRPIGAEERRALIELAREYTGILQQLIGAVEIPGVSKGDTYAKLDAYAEIKGIAYTDRRAYNYAEAAPRAVIQDILKSGPNLDERRTRADFVRHVAQEIAAFEQAAQKQSAPSMEKVKAPAPPQAATTPPNGTTQRQSVLDAAEEAQRLDAQGGSKRSAAAMAADERLAETIRNLISNEYQGVEDVTRSDKPLRQWTVKERELNSLIDRLETLQSAKNRTRSMTAATAQNIRETTRGRLIDEMRRRIEIDSRIKPTTPREQLTETAREVTQSKVREAVNQSQAFINDLIFNKQGKLTRARNRNNLKGYSDNGARSVAADIVSETMREVSPHLMNHTNRQNYENQAHVNIARVLSESKGLTREEIAVSIETVLRDTAQKTNVLNPPKEMVLPNQTGEISEFGERLTDRETVEIDVSSTPSPAREQLTETVRELTAPSSPLNIDQANAQDTLTETRTRNPESKAADKALIESARELAKTSERGEEIKSAALDLMNAQQLKRYKRATGDMSARAEDMIEKRREARERLRSATSGEVINNFETMPEVESAPKKRSGPDISRYKRALSLAKKAERLDKLKNNRRSKASREADQALIELAQDILEKDLGDVEVRTIYRKPSTMWTREESLKVAIGAMAGELKTRQRALGGRGGAEQAQELRADAREKLIDAIQEHVDRFLPDEEIDARLDRELARDARETAKQEAREAQEARQYQQKTFTPEIQSAIDNLRHPYQKTRVDSFESHFKTRKDGGAFRATLAPKDIAVRITSSLPREINHFSVGKKTLSSEIAAVIEQGLEDRKTPAELKDAIGETVTAYAEDNAVIDKESISSSKAIIELNRNITALTGTGLFDGDSFAREERFRRLPYIGLERLKNDMGDINKRIKASVSMGHVFTRRLSERLEKYEVGLPNRVRFNSSGPEVITAVYAEAYPTVGDIRENISEIRDELRTMIKEGLNGVTRGVANPGVFFNRIKSGYEKATEQKDKDREGHLDRAKKLAQYTDNPQAYLSEVQERERKSAQEISEQLETNREFADAYVHEAAKIIEDATENTKGELIENLLESRSAYQLKAPIEGKANRKLMARIFNEVFEQVRREIEDEPIERGEKHPRNIADTVKKPSKTPAQFRGDIERADEEKRARKLAEREARRAQRTQKSATHLIDYRAQLIQTIERIA